MMISSDKIWTDAATWLLPVMAGACAGVGLGIVFEHRLQVLQAQGRGAVHKLVGNRRGWRQAARLQLQARRGR